MKYVVIVNGKPRSGKTTFEKECIRYLDENEISNCYMLSSIDPIKEIYTKLGWNGIKTDKARKDLSTLKNIWISNNNGPTNYIIEEVMKLSTYEDHVIFVDIREESEIIKLMDVLEPLSILGIKYTTVFIDRPDNSCTEYGNKSDDMVGNNMSIYKYTIINDGRIGQLLEMARNFIKLIIEEDEENGK